MTGWQAMLEIQDLHAWYAQSHILQGATLHVGAGECVALLGRNGVGRSTLLKAVMGMVEATGSVRFEDTSLLGKPTYEIARLGIGYVPEDRQVFPNLTVEQNLALGAPRSSGLSAAAWTQPELIRLFPILGGRRRVRAGSLSGGEQQMLSLARTLAGNPSLLLIDEPTEGLAPMVVAALGRALAALRERGVAMLLVEQKMSIALDLSQRVYVMGRGRMVFEGTPQELKAAPAIQGGWLTV